MKKDEPIAVKYEQRLSEIDGIKTGTQAMKACGMQPEFAAYLAQQCSAMGVMVVLRAGSPPVYNQKRGPKTGFTLSKTAKKQGFLNGSLAADERFTRIEEKKDAKTGIIERKPVGHHHKDEHHLHLPINDPDYLHTMALPITMQDVLAQIGPDGDLKFLGYDEKSGLLRLCFKEDKGDPNFHGQFVINLHKVDQAPIFYSRPWDKPEHDPNWDSKTQMIRKPEELSMIPDDIYKAAFNGLMYVDFTETQSASPTETEIKPVKVFANTPRTSGDLRDAIQNSEVLSEETKQKIKNLEKTAERKDILALLSEKEIQSLYDECGLVTTGDWDGAVLGEPIHLPEKFRHVYHTFSQTNARQEMRGLLNASKEYFNYLKSDPKIKDTPLGRLLESIKDPIVLFSEFAITRAGSITPHEFVYEQLVNYAYRDEQNEAYGNAQSRPAMQEAMNIVLEDLSKNPTLTFEEFSQKAFQIYHKQGIHTQKAWQTNADHHFNAHLQIAFKQHATSYIVPNISYDHNVHDLFQHGFDMRNPYGGDLNGAWSMVTNNGLVIYGETEEKLIEVLLLEGFLETNQITVNPHLIPKKYDVALMSSIEGQMEKAKPNTVYLSETSHTYFVKGMKNPEELPKKINLNNLSGKLSDPEFKKTVLDYTSGAGHTFHQSKGWDKVVERQIKLKQPIAPETMKAFQEYNKKDQNFYRDSMKYLRRLSTGSSKEQNNIDNLNDDKNNSPKI
jgi:hypothetical protein